MEKRMRIWVAIGIGAVAALCLASGLIFDVPNAIAVRGLQVKGSDIVDQLEAYRDRQGKYPADLNEAGIIPDRAAQGEWRYSPSIDQSQFGLLAWRDAKGIYTLSYDKSKGWVERKQRSD